MNVHAFNVVNLDHLTWEGSGRTAYCNTKGHYEAEMIKGVKGFCTWMYTDLNRDFYLSLWTNFKKEKAFVAPEGVVWSLTNSRKESVLKTTSRNWKKSLSAQKSELPQYLISAWGYQLKATIGFTCITHPNQTVSGQSVLWVMHELCFNAEERIGVQVWSIFTSNAMTACLTKIKTLRLSYASLETCAQSCQNTF